MGTVQVSLAGFFGGYGPKLFFAKSNFGSVSVIKTLRPPVFIFQNQTDLDLGHGIGGKIRPCNTNCNKEMVPIVSGPRDRSKSWPL